MLKFESALNFTPPSDWLKITTIDAHTGGEPFRVIVDGFPELGGTTILERRRYAKEHYDHLRTALMWEPRGHADMYGCILTTPVTPEADFWDPVHPQRRFQHHVWTWHHRHCNRGA